MKNETLEENQNNAQSSKEVLIQLMISECCHDSISLQQMMEAAIFCINCSNSFAHNSTILPISVLFT